MSKKKKSKKELEKELEDLRKKFEKVQFKGTLLDALLKHIPDRIYFKDKKSSFLEVSKSKMDEVGLSRDELVGKSDFDFFPEEDAKQMFEDEKRIMESGEPVIDKEEEIELPDGKTVWVSATKVPFYDKKGNVAGTLGISRDITRRKLLELESEEKLKAQKEELIELSTPIIDVWEGVLTVPILGSLDSERASRISEALLTEIVEKRAGVAIIDISGISAVDSAVADLLIRTAKAVRLVGAEAVLTGVGVEVAQTISDLGINMESLKTMSTLREGLKYIFKKEKEEKEIYSKK